MSREQLKKIREDNFKDGNALKQKMATDPTYAEAVKVQKKAKEMLDKENGIT